MNITIKDVAKIANVSYATVSRALSGSKEVSESTRKRIVDICNKIGYSPNAIARGLVTSNTYTIGLIVPDITNPFYPEVALGVEDEARRNGYNIFLCNTNFEIEREKSYFKLLLEKRVEGIIIASISDEARNSFISYNSRLPIVYIGSDPKEISCNFVATDNVKAGFLAAEYLIKLGHNKIAFLGGSSGSNSYQDRLKGFMTAMKKNGLKPDTTLIKGNGFRRENGYKIIKGMIDEKIIPAAIIAANDLVALGVIEGCEELNLNVPEDISVIGFDDIPYASLPKIKLTTVSQSKYSLGKRAFDMVFKLLKDKIPKKGLQEILQPELMIRTTCKKA